MAPNIIKTVVSEGKGLAKKTNVNITSFMKNSAKFLATGLAVVLGTAFLIPLIRRIPFINKLASGGTIVASLILMGLATVLASLKFGFARFLAAGLGITAGIQLVQLVASPLIEKALAVVRV